jgi:hypothetical protein
MIMQRRFFAGLGSAGLVVLLLVGCAGTGPATIARDRFDYVTSVSDSWKRQMLLNLLKVRYSDAPVFMDIASVINSYELSGEVNLFGQIARTGAGDEIAGLGMSGRYADRPTITYQPLAGDKFTRSLMLPIPVPAILFLIQSGYPADVVLRICADSINGLTNSYGGPGRLQAGNPKFRELLVALRESQAAGGMGMRVKTAADKQSVVIFLRPSTDEAVTSSSRKVRELLGLNPSAHEYSVVYGSYPETDTEVAILSRSIMQVLVDMAAHVEVPEVDRVEGRVYDLQPSPEQAQLFPPLLKVRCDPLAPGDAHVAVKYRNHWFWIDDRDSQSKQIFNFMMFMFSLTETGSTQAAPIVTVPAR